MDKYRILDEHEDDSVVGFDEDNEETEELDINALGANDSTSDRPGDFSKTIHIK
jgi:hypothetical protein